MRKIIHLTRKSVRKIFHLSSWTSTAWLYYHNGGNIPDLLTTTLVSRNNVMTKMKVSSNLIAHYVRDKLTPPNEERMSRLNLLTVDNKKEEITKRL